MTLSSIIKTLFIPSLVGLLFTSCGNTTTETPKTPVKEEKKEPATNEISFTDAQYKTAGIQLGTVEPKQISGTFKANGVLDVPPQQKVSISVPLGGFLKKTDLLQGMRVKKGQLIAVIENPEYVQMQQDYLEAKSQLEYATTDYSRQQELAKENVTAQKTLQQAKASYQTLTARVISLKEKIKASGISLAALEKGNVQPSINIYAPISGFVTEINVNIGKYVNSTDVLFEIVDTEHLHAELTVFEKDVPRLQVGQRVRFTLANEETERTAKVHLIGREISKDRTIRIHCHLDKEDIHLLPGMYLKAIVETGQTKVPALPEEAIVDYLGQKYIFITTAPKTEQSAGQEYYFKMVPIQTGNSDMGFTEVFLPDTMGKADIVVKGAYAILSKMKNSGEEE